MKPTYYIVCLLVLLLFFAIPHAQSQGLSIGSSAYVRFSGSPKLFIVDGNFKNDGNYTKATEKVTMKGNVARVMHGSAVLTDMYDLEISNTGGITTRLRNLYAHNTDIIASSKFTIDTLSYVYVSNLLTNNATASGLHIKSNASKPGGSLAFMNPKESPVQATVEMYSKASWDRTQATGSIYKWQFFGIPVKTSAYALPLFYGSYVRKHNEAGKNQGFATNNLWIQLSENNPMTNITGYELVQEAPTTYTFTGELYNENFTKPLPNSGPEISQYPGQHLIGNPYTAAIDIKQITFDTNTQATVFIYNTGTLKQWNDSIGKTSSDSTAYIPGQYVAIPKLTAGESKLPRLIPTMQAFMVRTLGAATGLVTIDYSAVKQRNFSVQRAPQESLSSLRIQLIGEKSDNDIMWVFSKEGTTRKFDNGWDGLKMAGDAGTARIQSLEGDTTYQINTVPDIHETLITARAGANDTEYMLKITNENMSSKYPNIYLFDMLTKDLINITGAERKYAFTMTNRSSEPRFKILTSLQNVTDLEMVQSDLFAVAVDKTLIINNKTADNGHFTIYDVNGAALYNQIYPANQKLIVDLPLQAGVYVCKLVSSNGKVVSSKLILK